MWSGVGNNEGTRGDQGPVLNNPYAMLSIQQQKQRLPIFKNKNHILYLLERFQTLVIVGETGCGKSTQVPQYLMEVGWSEVHGGGRIGVTEPRRVAVLTLAGRVAEEQQSMLGECVGYVVRFEHCVTPRTKIKYMTDGILIREILEDPLLSAYSVIMVDEAHERSVQTDILLGLLRKIIQKRPDLKLIVASATLDAEAFRDFFNLNGSHDYNQDTSSIITVEGRMYPVDILYAKSPVANYVKATVDLVLKINREERVCNGDVLAFLTGQDEVDAAVQMLEDEMSKSKMKDKLWILPMYAALPHKEQLKVFDTVGNVRKVVIATNVAETSVTIPGIVFVIDCGFVKLRVLNRKNGIESLMVVPISQASAEQRSGRAGRIKPGKAFRLYTEEDYFKLPSSTVPEIQRCHLAPVILQLKALGIDNVLKFHYLARPSSFAMIEGLEQLYALDAIDRSGRLTQPTGFQLAEMPLSPLHAKVLLNSGKFGCSDEMLSIIAMLQVQEVFLFPGGKRHKAEMTKRAFSVEEGDHITLLNVYSSFVKSGESSKWCSENFLNYRILCRASDIRRQLSAFLKRYKIPIVSCDGDMEKVLTCLVSGLFCSVAKLHYSGRQQSYRTIREEYPLKLYQGSALMYRERLPEWVIFDEVLQDSIRNVSQIYPKWLCDFASHYYEIRGRPMKKIKLQPE